MEEEQTNVSENGNGNKFIAFIKKIYEGWLNIRAKLEEIMEPVLFFGGGTLTTLIALGILPWGALGIGICATLTFIGISRFVLTNSWTHFHNKWGKNESEDEEEVEEPEVEETIGTGFVKSNIILLRRVQYIVSPRILAFAGIVFGGLGAIGVLGLGLALGIAIPSLILVAMALVSTALEQRNKVDLKTSDNFWGVSMLVAGLLSVATFAVLGLTGVLAWSTAIALGAPGLALAGIMALIFVGTRIGFWVKNRGKGADGKKEPCIFIGLSWNPEWLVSKKEEVENKIFKVSFYKSKDSDKAGYDYNAN